MCGKCVAVLACALTCSLAWAQSREVEIVGRTLKCGNARIFKDSWLPDMGAASPDLNEIVLNPRLLRRLSKEVRWFIFYHECGHVMGHLNEIKADEYAIMVASREGWLTQDVLAKICRSWGGMDEPATSTHPAPSDRCNALLAAASRYQKPVGDPSVGTMVTSGPNPFGSEPLPPVVTVPKQPDMNTGSSHFVITLPEAIR